MAKSTVENLQRTGQGKNEDSGISIKILSDLQVRDRTLKDVRNKWHVYMKSEKVFIFPQACLQMCKPGQASRPSVSLRRLSAEPYKVFSSNRQIAKRTKLIKVNWPI